MNAFIEWLRFPGRAVFIVGGVLPLLYLRWLAVRHSLKRTTTLEEPETILFTEVIEATPGSR